LILDLTDKTPGAANLGGQRVPTMTFRYTVTASRPGTYVLPSFTVNAAGSPVTVPAAQLVVQEPSHDDLPYQPAQAVLDLAEGEYYVGQTIITRLLILDTPDETVQAVANVAKPSGDILFQSQSGSRRERVKWRGKNMSALVTPLRLTPIKPGETEIALQTIVFVNKLNATGRPSGNTAQAMLDTRPIRIRVRSLPETERKPGFTGAIGKFQLGQPVLSTPGVVVGDPITLKITITGEGNLEAIGAPVMEESEAWQSFTPTSEVNRDTFGAQGSKTITYTLIPRRADVKTVPAMPFSYFDPERKEYVDLSIPPVSVSVRPGTSAPPETAPAPTAAATPAPNATPTPIENPEAKKSEPILTGLAEKTGSWRSSPSPIAWRPGFWLVQLIPAGALLGLWLWRRRIDFLAAHPEIVRRRAARADARKHLRQARLALERKDSDGFVSASLAAIRSATAPLDSTQAESLVFQEVFSKMPGQGEARTTVERLFARAHARKFSGHGVEADGVFALFPEVEKTVAAIERQQP
jgi:hypothetical protein